MSSYNPMITYYRDDGKKQTLRKSNSVDRHTRFVELKFSTIEERNNYMKDAQRQRDNADSTSLEDRILQKIYHLRPVKHIAIVGQGDGHATTKTSHLSDSQISAIKASGRGCGDLVGWHRTKHTVKLYNPFGDDWGWFAGCESRMNESGRDNTVTFVYTCALDELDLNFVNNMNLEQAKKTYASITLNDISNYDDKSLQWFVDEITAYTRASMSKWKSNINLKTCFDSRMVVQIDIEVLGDNGLSDWGLANYPDMGYIELDNNNQTARLAMATSRTTVRSSSAKSRGTPNWFDYGRGTCAYMNGMVDTRGGVIINGLEEIPEDGGLRCHIFHAYRLDASDDKDQNISYYDGYGESVKEIELALQLAQQLKDKYAQYKADFEKEFNRLVSSKEYENLLLNEEFLTICDVGPEVATINESLFLLNYARNTQNANVYSQQTYDGVIQFKQYMRQIDSDLYDILEIAEPCCSTDAPDPRCNSNQGPCGCWTYACYLFKEMTFMTNEEDVSLNWDDSCTAQTLFSVVNHNGVSIQDSTCFLSKASSSSLEAYINSGYEGRIRIKAFDLNGNELGLNHSKVTPNETPFKSSEGNDCYWLDILVRSLDKFSASFDGVKWNIELTRTTPSGDEFNVEDPQQKIGVGQVIEYPSLFTVETLKIEVLDGRPPYSDWKMHGLSSPPGWGRVNGVSALSRVAKDFTEAIKKSGEWGMDSLNIPIQLEISFGVEVFYVISFEIGGFVGVELCVGAAPNKFVTGAYAASKIDLGGAGVNARIEHTNEWLWEDTTDLLDAVKDWINGYLPEAWEFPLPAGFRGASPKLTTSYGSKLGDVTTTYEESMSSLQDPHPVTKFSIDNQALLNHPNFTELETKSGNEGYTKLSYGWQFEGGLYPKINHNHDLPDPPTLPSYVTQPTDFRYRAIQGIAQLLEDSSLTYSNLDLSALLSGLEHLKTVCDLAGYVPDKLSFEPWKKLGKATGNRTGFSIDYKAHLKFQIISESTCDTQAILSQPNDAVFSQTIQRIETSKFGFGLTFGGGLDFSFKVFFYPNPWISVYLGAKLSLGLNWGGKIPIMTNSKTIAEITPEELKQRLLDN